MANVAPVEAQSMSEPDHQASVDVAAPPESVWAVVSDVTRTPEWSPVVRRSEWVGPPGEPLGGARFRGHNRFNGFRWSRECVVSDARPGAVFAFSTFGRGQEQTRWRYELEPRPDGTRVWLAYEIVSTPRWVSLVRRLPFGAEVNDRQARQNIEESLDRLRALLEPPDRA